MTRPAGPDRSALPVRPPTPLRPVAPVRPAPLVRPDRYDSDVALGATGTLAAFNQAGVLSAADVHVAMRLAQLAGDPDDQVALAAALAVRAPRVGHVYVDLATVRHSAADEDEELDLDGLPWPDARHWVGVLAGSALVAVGEDGPDARPLRLIGTALYLDRYWRDERSVADALLARVDDDAARARHGPDESALAGSLARLFPSDARIEPRWAAATAVIRRLCVIAGGPGSGKTTTVARVVALLDEQAAAEGRRPPLVGLVAPTGKAAARLEEAVQAEAPRIDVSPAVRQRLLSVRASTVHRLLGARPDSASRFRHHRHHRLPHDVIVVDETSMVALSLMARLVEAVRPDARLILVGDPEQLASVEAGAVLGDIVGPARQGMRMSPAAQAQLGRIAGVAPDAAAPPAGVGVGDSVVLLRGSHRFGGSLAELAAAVGGGDEDRALRLLSSGDPFLRWVQLDDAGADAGAMAVAPVLEPIRTAAITSGAALFKAAVDGDGEAALDALGRFRVLCAHRHGPSGASSWTERIEDWLSLSSAGIATGSAWYPGRPVMVTANDYGLRLFNGDTGVVVARQDDGVTVAFRRGGSLVSISPARLSAVVTVFAMTIHKAQGSEFSQVAVVLPGAGSAVLTRQLLYTAVTHAQESLIVAGSELAIRAALSRPIARASGLTHRLWSSSEGP